MLTTYKTPGTAEAPAGPTKQAVAAYRELVFSQVETPDADVLQAAWRIELDYRTDLAVYRRRLDAAYIRTVELPRLERALREAKAAQAAEETTGARRVADFATVAALAAALTQHVAESTPGYLSPARAKVFEAQQNLTGTRPQGEFILRETADPAIGRKMGELQLEISSLEGQVHSLEEITTVDERIKRQEAKLQALADPSALRQERETYPAERRKLAELEALRPQKARAAAEIAQHQHRIAELRTKLRELDEQRLDPKCMEWTA